MALLASGTAYAVPDICDSGSGALLGNLDPSANSQTYWRPDSAGDALGRAIAVGDFNGDGAPDLAFSAPGVDINGVFSGAVYVVLSPNAALTASGIQRVLDVDVVILGESAYDYSGYSLAGVGDVDNDGKDDLLIGSLPLAGASGGAGIAHLVSGATITANANIDLLTQSTARFLGQFNGDEFGSAVAGVGDVNNDSFADIVIGAPKFSGVGNKIGAAYLWLGPVTGDQLAGVAEDTRFDGATTVSSFGIAIAGVGDTNNDGYDDFLVGAPRDTTAASRAGAAYLFRGAGSLPATVPASGAAQRMYGAIYDRCGSSVAAAGDVNNDGLTDFWVGCKQYGSFKWGTAYLVGGNTGTGAGALDNLNQTQITATGANDLAGSSIAAADFDGDGYLDVLIGGERGAGNVFASGAAWIEYGPFLAGERFLGNTADATFRGINYEDFYGAAVAAADFNGDGYGDAIVSGFRSDDFLQDGGRLDLFGGGADTADLTTYWEDSDSDGYGNVAASTDACSRPVGFVENSLDCNDASNLFYPSAPEGCSDPDYNCDGYVGTTDHDLDGYAACQGDCNDSPTTGAGINPGALERCNDGIDNNCDGAIDDSSAADAVDFYPDADGDGFGDAALSIRACQPPIPGLLRVGGDCNDTPGFGSSINPDAVEVCGDAIDNDCANGIDDGGAIDATVYWADLDSDGFGDPDSTVRSCIAPLGYASNRDDCNDTIGSVNPNATETCDYQDNDCLGINYSGGPVSSSTAFTKITGQGSNQAIRAGGFIRDWDFDGDDELIMTANFAPGLSRDVGVVYIRFGRFEGEAVDLNTERADGTYEYDIRIVGTRNDAIFGTSVASGDFNGDGFADLVVGSPGARVPNVGQGAVYVFFGPMAAGEYVAEDADLILRGEAPNGNGTAFGTRVVMGDLDGDGFSDIVASAPFYEETLPRQGKVYVLYGRAASLSNGRIDTLASAWILGSVGQEGFGNSLAILGDLNNDNRAELAIGAPNNGSLGRGAVYLKYGAAARFSAAFTTDVTLAGANNGDRFGLSLAGVNDFNGDGFRDFLVGTDRNLAYLVLGSGTQLATGSITGKYAVRFVGLFGQTLGRSVSGVGDINQDGFFDITISAADDDEAGQDAGATYLVYGRTDLEDFSADGMSLGYDFVVDNVESFARIENGVQFPVYRAADLRVFEGAKFLGESSGDAFTAVRGGGDYDGDGYPDMVGSAPGVDLSPLSRDHGRVYVFLGGSYGTDVFVGDTSQQTWYWDSDADGFTADSLATFVACAMHVPISWRIPSDPRRRGALVPSLPDLDCDDDNWRVYPGATEVEGTDGVDSDCDGYDIPNILPIVSVNLTPETPLATDALFANITVIDNDPINTGWTPEYQWLRNGTLLANNAQTLPNTATNKGDLITVRFRVDDTRGVTDWVEDSVTIENSAPTLDACRVTPTNVGVTSTMTVQADGLFDDDPSDAPFLSVNFRWQKLLFPSWVDIPGSTYNGTGPTDVSTTRDSCVNTNVPATDPGFIYNCVRGSSVRAVCTPRDPGSVGIDYFSDPVQFQNTLPLIETCQVSPASPDTQDDLVATGTATDADVEAVTVNLEFIINGDSANPIPGSVLSSAVTSHFDQIVARCTPQDAFGGVGTSVLSNLVTVRNTAPTAPTIDLLPDFPRSNQQLGVTILAAASDIDGDLVTYEYRWQKDGAPFNNPTYPTNVSTVSISSTRKGETWRVTVTATDGYDAGGSDTDSVLILNTPPTITGASITPLTPESRQPLTAVTAGYFDFDNDPNSSVVDWYVNGVVVQSGPSILPANLALRGQQVFIVIRSFDGEDYGNSATSGTVTILNSPPEAIVLGDMDPIPASEFDDIDCTFITPSSDFDNDSITYRVVFKADRPVDPFIPQNQWVVNRVTLKTTTTALLGAVAAPAAWRLAASATSYGDTIWCEVTPNDGFVDGPTTIADSVLIQDLTAPPTPVLNNLERYRNSEAVTLSGTCVDFPLECGQLYHECYDSSNSPVFPQVSTPDGPAFASLGNCNGTTFNDVVTLPRGDTYRCFSYCLDIGPNRSFDSTQRTTEVCNPYDEYDLRSATLGDSAGAAVDDWGAFPDNNSVTQQVYGNIIGTGIEFTDTEDWFLFRTADSSSPTEDGTRNETYNFQIDMDQGAADYTMRVYRLFGGNTTDHCAADTNGYDQYNFYNIDRGDYTHPDHGPIAANSCDSTTALYNNCTNYTSDYQVRITRDTPKNCVNYRLTVTNGGANKPANNGTR